MSRVHPDNRNGYCYHNISSSLLRSEKGNGADDHDHHPSRRRTNNHNNHRKSTPSSSALTVWKKSSMSFHGTDGFTVFDPQGRLVFRVDNYSRKKNITIPCAPRDHSGGGLVLMDGVGNELLTLKPQKLSMHHRWNAYTGVGDMCGSRKNNDNNSPKTTTPKVVFSMRRSPSSVIFRRPEVAEIFIGGLTTAEKPDLTIEGSFRARDCKIKTPAGDVVAKVSRKRVTMNPTILLGDDVFSLQVVQPDFQTHLIMAFVIVLDRISNKSFPPVFMCC